MQKLTYLTIQSIFKVFDKKTNLLPLLLICLLLAGRCPNNNQVPITSISDTESHPQINKVADNKPQVSISSCRSLGSLSCMEGSKTDFLLQVKGCIANIDPQLKGQIGFIGIPANGNEIEEFINDLEQKALDDGNAALSTSIVQNAICSKNKVEEFLWQDEDVFNYWNAITKVGTGPQEWTIRVDEAAYKKLTSNKYAIYIICAKWCSCQRLCNVSYSIPNGYNKQGCIATRLERYWFRGCGIWPKASR